MITHKSFILLSLLCFGLWAHDVQAATTASSIYQKINPQYLIGHKAIYDVKLLSAKNGSQIVGISGKMTFSWKPSCDGYITDHSFKLRYDYADTDPSFIESHFTTYENLKHDELQFSSRRARNGTEEERIRGSATPAKAIYQLPEPATMVFSSQPIFPTRHSVELIESAINHKKFLSNAVFDGSDMEGIMNISTVIGSAKTNQIFIQKMKDQKIPTSVDQALLKGTSWPLRMAFFAATEDQPNADYEMSLILHENGVISDMVIDYSDFTIRQKLVSLEKIPADHCGPQGKMGK